MLKGGEAMDYGVCVWSAGNAPRPLVQQVGALVADQEAACKVRRMQTGQEGAALEGGPCTHTVVLKTAVLQDR